MCETCFVIIDERRVLMNFWRVVWVANRFIEIWSYSNFFSLWNFYADNFWLAHEIPCIFIFLRFEISRKICFRLKCWNIIVIYLQSILKLNWLIVLSYTAVPTPEISFWKSGDHVFARLVSRCQSFSRLVGIFRCYSGGVISFSTFVISFRKETHLDNQQCIAKNLPSII
jgi:hypothetical protein